MSRIKVESLANDINPATRRPSHSQMDDNIMNRPLEFSRVHGNISTSRPNREDMPTGNTSPPGSGNRRILGGVMNRMGETLSSNVTTGGPASGSMSGPMSGPMCGPMPGPMPGPFSVPMSASIAGPMSAPMAGPMSGPMTGPRQSNTYNGPVFSTDLSMNMTNPAMGMQGFNVDQMEMMRDPSMSAASLEVDGKEVLHFDGFKLVPPPPGAPPRSTREKPPGCRTAFVGGLPETVTEEMVGELMQTCGLISKIRLGKKFFAHVRFESFESVDKAIFYSGWRMKIGDKDDKPNTGRLHCDYATARDDQYEYECMQRAIEREQRHQLRMIADMNRPPSPPPVARYSDTEAGNVTEMLKSSQAFSEGATMLIEWLDKGQVSSRNANRFYTMLHSVNSAVRRLTGEKKEFEQELNNYKIQYNNKVTGLLTQMEQIQNVFVKARQQKVWDHFSKTQRKHVELWTKQCEEVKEKQDDEMLANREEDEMDLSDDEGDAGAPSSKRARMVNNDEMNGLRDENDSLKCQLEAYKNELDLNKQENATEMERKTKQITMLQQMLVGMQEQLLSARTELNDLRDKTSAKPTCSSAKDSADKKEGGEEPESAETAAVCEAVVTESVDVDGSASDTGTPEVTSEVDSSMQVEISASDKTAVDASETSTQPDSAPTVSEEVKVADVGSSVDAQTAHMLGLLCCYLHVHPFGACVEEICTYLQRAGLTVNASQVDTTLQSYSQLFTAKVCGLGVNFEKRWRFIGFHDDTMM